MNDIRLEYRTRFFEAPMQIEVGLTAALSRLNGNPIESLEVRVLGGGDSDPLHTHGPIDFPTGADREYFYKKCQESALQGYCQASRKR